MSKRSDFLTCQQVLSTMVLSGFVIHHMLRSNISIAIVEMVARNSSNETYGPTFRWDEEEKNNVLGFFFWGYLITQIPGGTLSEKIGAKIVVGSGLMMASILTILTPIASQLNYYCLLLVRFCLGMTLGIQWPSTPPIATKWIAPTDTSKFMSHMQASSLGVALTLPVCGYLILYWGWPSVFYVTGSIALLWTMVWFCLVYDTPDKHPRISESEKETLKSKIRIVDSSTKKSPIPWVEIMTSPSVWAVIVGNICTACTFFIALNQLPTYMSQVLHFDIKTIGWFSSLPYSARYFVSLLSSVLADKIQKTGKFSTTAIRKFFTTFLFFGTSCIFVAQVFWGYDAVVTIVVFTGSIGLMGLATPGFHTSPVDMAPAYSGTIFGISQVPGALAGYITTKLVALVTKEKQTFGQWVYVFWFLVGVNLFAAVFSLIFISGSEQSWSLKEEQREAENSKLSSEN